MPLTSKVLEDSIRLARLRKIKLTLYVVQVVMLVALAILLIFVMGKAQVTPVLYLPLDDFAAVIVLLILVVSLESFFFRAMEIKFARSSSAKHLMAKNSIRAALMVAIVAAAVAIVLVAPPILTAIQDSTSKTAVLSADTPVTFWSRDPLALQTMVEVEVSSANMVEVYLVEGEVYDEYEGDISLMSAYSINKDNCEVDDDITIDVPKTDHKKYVLVLNDFENPGSAATVTIVRDVSGMFTGIISILTIAIVGANVAWIVYLLPIERKYSRGSIYK
jgi:hypothetical protein